MTIPELEAELDTLLDFPKRDPHDRDIPRGLASNTTLEQDRSAGVATPNPNARKSAEP